MVVPGGAGVWEKDKEGKGGHIYSDGSVINFDFHRYSVMLHF